MSVASSPKKEGTENKILCPSTYEGPESEGGKGKEKGGAGGEGELMCKLVSVLYGSPIIYSAAQRSRRATRICLILNYTLVYITWQSVHINLIGF